MLPLMAGQKYLIETPRWYYVGEVAEAGSLIVKFRRGAQVHWMNDMPTTLATGKFSSGDEITPIPGEFMLPAWMCCGLIFPWPHALPMQRTHGPVE